MNTPEKLFLQYTFHLKTLENAKKHINSKIKQLRKEIKSIDDENKKLCVSQPINKPAIKKPSKWYSYSFAGKWLLTIIIIFVIDMKLKSLNFSNIYYILFRNIVFVLSTLLIISNVISNRKQIKKYCSAIHMYTQECEIEQQRLSSEEEKKTLNLNRINTLQVSVDELSETLDTVKAARDLLYSANYIPYQFRNLESITFFYSQIHSSTITLDELIRYETKRVFEEYNGIPYFIKFRDEIYSYLTIKKYYFWNSCQKLTNEMVNYISNKGESSLENKMEALINTMKNSSTNQYFYGPAVVGTNNGIVGDSNSGNVEIMSSINPSIENEGNKEALEMICNDLAEKIVKSNSEMSKELIIKLERMKIDLLPKESETRASWAERVEQGLGIIANIAGIADFSFAALSQLNKF